MAVLLAWACQSAPDLASPSQSGLVCRSESELASRAVAVGVSVGTGLGVAVAVGVGVSLGIGVAVAVAVGVSVGTGLGVAVAVGLGVAVSVGLSVGVAVGVGDGRHPLKGDNRAAPALPLRLAAISVPTIWPLPKTTLAEGASSVPCTATLLMSPSAAGSSSRTSPRSPGRSCRARGRCRCRSE